MRTVYYIERMDSYSVCTNYQIERSYYYFVRTDYYIEQTDYYFVRMDYYIVQTDYYFMRTDYYIVPMELINHALGLSSSAYEMLYSAHRLLIHVLRLLYCLHG